MRLSNQTQALELERANTKKYQDAVETQRQRTKEESNRLHEDIEALRRQVAAAKKDKTDVELLLERERISRSTLETELERLKVLQGEALGEEFDFKTTRHFLNYLLYYLFTYLQKIINTCYFNYSKLFPIFTAG